MRSVRASMDGYQIEYFDTDPEPLNLHSGKRLGNFVVGKEIGRGGMGTIYLAEHAAIGRKVAVKFLGKALVSDPVYLDLFLREARSAAHLNHPGIVQVYDAGSLDPQTHYLMMEFVDGKDLQSILHDCGVLEPRQAVHVIRQAAEALEYAHQKGFIHRDVKPENLLWLADGSIKICDLGLAKLAGETGLATQVGSVMGSPLYMAPERLSESPKIDGRVDVYSLGATFFHLLTGRIPYTGTPPVIMSQHLSGPLPDPRELVPTLDPSLTSIIAKMMAKKPGDRFQTMGQVVQALSLVPL
ncbi:MAG: serine/threonine protein kinase [Verrucomicrobiae bacterium]|nr:serine/threonine protein kinase [Verrucomicrobiae bacterium]